MKKLVVSIWLIGLVASDLSAQVPSRRAEAEVLRGRRLTVPSERQAAADESRAIAKDRRTRGQKKAREMGLPVRTVRANGTVTEVVDLDEKSDRPVYFVTHNLNAAISTGASTIRVSNGLTGTGVVVGVWDGGVGRGSHQEFPGSRLSNRDGGAVGDHATHVAGTIIASGVKTNAMGMAPSGLVDAYDWLNDTAEMISRASASPNDTGKIKISNHSYGYVRGWEWDGTRYAWGGYSGGALLYVEEYFGLYGTRSRSIDSIAYNAPYYLMFFSAGNERSNNPSSGSLVSINGSVVSYNTSIHPLGDGVYKSGYDTLADSAVSKNAMVVGAVNDAVTWGARDPSKATPTTFTSWGPTDDGRIKPDIVANGASVYSPVGTSDSSYSTYSGTSMASPNAAGTAALLVEHYAKLFPGKSMMSSTLRGLIIHTADDRGRVGPDYQYGWGLINGQEAVNLVSDHASNPAKSRMMEASINNVSSSKVHQFVWDGVSPIRATICWTDPPGNNGLTHDNRARNLVNDLNLKMIAPNGTEFFPYVMPFVGTWTQSSVTASATTGVNSTDNVEQVYLANPPSPGVYQLVVSRANTLTGTSQSYSLFVSGSKNPNLPPTLPALGNLSVSEDSIVPSVQFSISDPDTSTGLIQTTVNHNNPGLIKELLLQSSGQLKTIGIVLVPDANGEATIQITLSDGENQVSSSFTLNVTAVDDPPSIAPLPSVIISRTQRSLNIPVFVTDIDSPTSELTVRATAQNPSIFTYINLSEYSGSRQLEVVAGQEEHGKSIIEIVASDLSSSTSTSFEISVENPRPSFAEWISSYQPEDVSGFYDDPDNDGVANVAEYFHGLDPARPSNPSATVQGVSGSGVIFEYRRSKLVRGLVGKVKWSTSLDGNATWTEGGVTDIQMSQDATHEWRRATVPWPTGQDKVFMRLELSPSEE